MITFRDKEIRNPILKALAIILLIVMFLIFIPLWIFALLVGIIAYCLGMPATITIGGEKRKYRWFRRIA